MPGTLFVVATPIGNLDDITLRALRILGTVSLIAAEDTRRTAILLRRHGISTPTVSFHEHNERQRTGDLLRRLQAGDNLAVVSDAGTPLVSDPGARLVEAALEAGVRVESIPGPSAVLAAVSASGLAAERFTFLGFAPPKSSRRLRWFESLRGVPGVLVFFEAPHRVRASLQDLRKVLGERQIVIARELTKMHETVQRGWVSELLQGNLTEKGEFTILVSDQQQCVESHDAPSSDDELLASFCRMTEYEDISSRDAVAILAGRHSRHRQEVYDLLRRAGKLG